MMRRRWGDADDDEDALPESTTVGPNDRGIITKTEYYKNPKGVAMKKITKIQLVKVQTKVYEITAERKQWPKFGLAGSQGNRGVTVQSVDQVTFERTNLPKKEEKKDTNAAKSAMEGRSLTDVMEEKRRQRELMRAQGLLPEPEAPPTDMAAGAAGAARKDGVYVPPSRKAGYVSDRPREADHSLRVSNLSETVDEGALRDLFGRFGDVSRVCVVYDRDTGEHRGFAFVNFRSKMAALKAIEILDGYGYENMILRVEMAAPREPPVAVAVCLGVERICCGLRCCSYS